MVVVYSLPFFNMCGVEKASLIYYASLFQNSKRCCLFMLKHASLIELQKVGDLVRKLIWYLTI